MQPQNKSNTSVYFWGKFQQVSAPIPKQVVEISKCQISKVASGGFFYLAANDDGELWGWGTVKHSRYGISTGDFVAIPKKVPLKFKVNKIAAGNWHSMITDSQGNTYGVGHNKYGALGLGHMQNVSQFTKCQTDFKVAQVTAGDGYSIVISTQGQMYGTGHNSFHGHKSKDNLSVFKKIREQQKFSKVNAGFTHALAISQAGQVYSWGQGVFFQLGHGNKDNVKVPKKVEGMVGKKVVSVSCTRGQKYAHSMAATEDGQVYTWGSGYKGKLGHCTQWTHADPADQPVPKLMKCEIEVSKVLAGGIHSGVLSKNGQLFTFGCGSDGRIGHPESTDHRYLYREGLPRKIQTFNNCFVIDSAFSYYHNICVVRKNK